MISLWIIISLVIASLCVSTLGAVFSIDGLGALFSGAALAISAMAASLELAKFVLAAYLHQTWKVVNPVMKIYMLFAIVTLSGITSMGIFGFLSNAYQSSSSVLEAETIKVEAKKVQQKNNNAEVVRLNRMIDEIPGNRLTKKMEARSKAEPAILALIKNSEQIDKDVAQSNIKLLAIKQKVGPLIYISKIFKVDIDVIVKYLILVIVSVFDPLAICLVVAATGAMDSRKKFKEAEAEEKEKVAIATRPPLRAATSEELSKNMRNDEINQNVV